MNQNPTALLLQGKATHAADLTRANSVARRYWHLLRVEKKLAARAAKRR